MNDARGGNDACGDDGSNKGDDGVVAMVIRLVC